MAAPVAVSAPLAPPSTAWALLLEYDGTPFLGWQRQAEGLTVQGVLEEAARRLSGSLQASCAVAGRTDTGVHAAGQVALLLLRDGFHARQVRDALNFHLRPHPVAVLHAAPAAPGWHPRFSAVGRAYAYRILNRRAPPVLDRNRAWHVDRALDAAAMQAAAALLTGHHDFTSFRATACQAKSPLRTLRRLDVARDGEAIWIRAEAPSFLHHQVRNMVGTLKLVGEGRWRPEDVAAALAARDRRAAGPTAPPGGLTLLRVDYPDDLFAPL